MSPIETLTFVIPARFHRAVTTSAVAIAAVVAGAVSACAAGTAVSPAVLTYPAAAAQWPAFRLAGTASLAGGSATAGTWSAPPLPGAASPAATRASELTAPPAHPVQLDIVLVSALTTNPVHPAAAQRKHARAPRQIAIGLLHRFGWRAYQFRYLNLLWTRESSWRVHARNPYSGAYGIPQAVPGARMAAAGRHWRTSARTQILWGLRYIKQRYGSPHRAWLHELAAGWY